MDRHKLQEVIANNRHFTESRKVSLFSNFARLEDTNPDGYEANVIAWEEVLADAVKSRCFADATCIEAGPELVNALSDPRNGIPLSLHCVFDNMVEAGAIVPLDRFRAEYPAAPSSSAVSGVLGWVFRSLVPRGKWSSIEPSGDGLKREKYVDLGAVREGARRLARALEEHARKEGNSILSKVYTSKQAAAIADAEYSELDMECLLVYAAKEKLLLYNKDADVVKLPSGGPITQVDSSVTSLRTHIDQLSKREAALEDKISDLERRAREVVKANRKQAKVLLQKKQALEQSLSRTSGSLNQLEAVLAKIENADDNKQAFAALQSSSAVLDQLADSVTVEDVEGLREHLQDAVEDVDEVTSSLADLDIGRSSADREVEDMRLDEELKQMEDEELAKKLGKLPSAPQHRPAKEQQAAGGARQELHEEPKAVAS